MYFVVCAPFIANSLFQCDVRYVVCARFIADNLFVCALCNTLFMLYSSPITCFYARCLFVRCFYARFFAIGMSSCKGDLDIPEFKFSDTHNLNQALIALGIEDAFQAKKAGLDELSETPQYLASSLHHVFVDVNRNGTEAAAVTGMETLGLISSNESECKFTMKCDHPFLFVIINKNKNTVLFTGIVNNPEGAASTTKTTKSGRGPRQFGGLGDLGGPREFGGLGGLGGFGRFS
jgi:hypothetical protein